jgi:hypothetical protein
MRYGLPRNLPTGLVIFAALPGESAFVVVRE